MTVEQLISILETQPHDAQVFCLDVGNGSLLFGENPIADVVVATIHKGEHDGAVSESIPKVVIRYQY